MSSILSGLEGVVCLVDEVLVFGENQQAHDKALRATLERIKEAGLTLNKEKCEFSKTSVKFLGQVIDQSGVKPDPDKISAIVGMKTPTGVPELRRFLGMVNKMTKFSPHLANKQNHSGIFCSRRVNGFGAVTKKELFNKSSSVSVQVKYWQSTT